MEKRGPWDSTNPTELFCVLPVSSHLQNGEVLGVGRGLCAALLP